MKTFTKQAKVLSLALLLSAMTAFCAENPTAKIGLDQSSKQISYADGIRAAKNFVKEGSKSLSPNAMVCGLLAGLIDPKAPSLKRTSLLVATATAASSVANSVEDTIRQDKAKAGMLAVNFAKNTRKLSLDLDLRNCTMKKFLEKISQVTGQTVSTALGYFAAKGGYFVVQQAIRHCPSVEIRFRKS